MTKNKLFTTLFFVAFCLTTCAQTKPTVSGKNSSLLNVQFKQKDTSYWVDNFRQFRDGLYKKDKSKAKEFLDFPFKNPGNEIWYLVYADNEKALDKLDENVKTLTEKDFEKYFDKIFTKPLINCFLKIKMDDLYKKGKSESPMIKDSSNTYKLYTSYDKLNKIVELNLAINATYKTSDTKYEAGESNFMYQFLILQNGHIKLKKILIAG